MIIMVRNLYISLSCSVFCVVLYLWFSYVGLFISIILFFQTRANPIANLPPSGLTPRAMDWAARQASTARKKQSRLSDMGGGTQRESGLVYSTCQLESQ